MATRQSAPKLQSLYRDAAEHLHTLRDLLRFSVSQFNAAGLAYGHGTDNAYDEAAYLLLYALNLPLDRLEPFLDALLLDSEKVAALQLVQLRVTTRKPAAYLTGEGWLGPYRFLVNDRVIVPRSFIAELLLDAARWPLVLPSKARILDLCTGGGSIAIVAAHRFADATVDAVDLDPNALELAHANVDLHGLEGRVFPVESDLFAGLHGQRYDLIVSNPPYVDALSMAALPDEYQHEPIHSLASGTDGLDHTHRILRDAGPYLAPEGILAVEIGHHREALERAYPLLPFQWLETANGGAHVFTLSARQLMGKDQPPRRKKKA
jgi:ribosomal protein L3 glutamine methyltransferase